MTGCISHQAGWPAVATGIGMAMRDIARSLHAADTKSLKKYDRSITRLSALV